MTTSQLSMGPNMQGSTLFPEDSLANLLVLPGSDEARRMTVSSGLRCCEWFPKQNPLLFLVKMLLGSSIWASNNAYMTWEPLVTKGQHLYFRLVQLEPRISDTGVSSWLPTPIAQMMLSTWKTAEYLAAGMTTRDSGASIGVSLAWLLAKWHIQLGNQRGNLVPDPCLCETMMGFPIGWTDLEPSGTP